MAVPVECLQLAPLNEVSFGRKCSAFKTGICVSTCLWTISSTCKDHPLIHRLLAKTCFLGVRYDVDLHCIPIMMLCDSYGQYTYINNLLINVYS